MTKGQNFQKRGKREDEHCSPMSIPAWCDLKLRKMFSSCTINAQILNENSKNIKTLCQDKTNSKEVDFKRKYKNF